LQRKWLDHGAVWSQYFSPKRSVGAIDVYKKVASAKGKRAGYESSFPIISIQGGKAIPPQESEANAPAIIHSAGIVGCNSGESRIRENELPLENKEDAGRTVQITSVPITLSSRCPEESGPIRSIPVESISAETELQVGELGMPFNVTRCVIRPTVDVMHPDHKALIGNSIEAVELRGIAYCWIGFIQPIGVGPVDAILPVSSLYEMLRFRVIAATAPRTALLYAEYPHLSKRIVEKRRIVCRAALLQV
jgi:hypothetical protein